MKKLLLMVSIILMLIGCGSKENDTSPKQSNNIEDNIVYNENYKKFSQINDNEFVSIYMVDRVSFEETERYDVNIYKDVISNLSFSTINTSEGSEGILVELVIDESTYTGRGTTVENVFLIDLNRNDEFKEIAVYYGDVTCNWLYFLRYNGKEIFEIGYIPILYNTELFIDINTGIMVNEYIPFLPTNITNGYYVIENNELKHIFMNDVIQNEFIIDRNQTVYFAETEALLFAYGEKSKTEIELKIGDKIEILEPNGAGGYYYFKAKINGREGYIWG